MTLTALLAPLGDFDGHMDWDGGWSVLMVVGMVVFWALIIAAAVWLVRELGRTRAGVVSDEDPLKILDRRLADGSITPEDYRERRAVLTDRRPEP